MDGSSNISKIKLEVDGIEEFVKQANALQRISERFAHAIVSSMLGLPISGPTTFNPKTIEEHYLLNQYEKQIAKAPYNIVTGVLNSAVEKYKYTGFGGAASIASMGTGLLAPGGLFNEYISDIFVSDELKDDPIVRARNQLKYIEDTANAISGEKNFDRLNEKLKNLGNIYSFNPNTDKFENPENWRNEELKTNYLQKIEESRNLIESTLKYNPYAYGTRAFFKPFRESSIQTQDNTKNNAQLLFQYPNLSDQFLNIDSVFDEIQDGFDTLGEQFEETSGQIEKDWKACASKFGDGFENSFGLVQTGFTNSGGYATTFANTGISAARDMLASMIGTADGSLAAAYQAYGIEMPGYMLNLASEHDSIMTGLGTTTNAAYKSMIGSAGGFFDQMTYGTNTVLKKLLTGEIGKQNQMITDVKKAADGYMAIAA